MRGVDPGRLLAFALIAGLVVPVHSKASDPDACVIEQMGWDAHAAKGGPEKVAGQSKPLLRPFDVRAVRKDPQQLAQFVSQMNELSPAMRWQLKSGMVKVDLSPFTQKLTPWLEANGYSVDRIILLADGKKAISVPASEFLGSSEPKFTEYFAGTNPRQTDLHVYVVGRGPDGKPQVLFTSNWQMFPNEHFMHVEPSSFKGEPLPSMTLPDHFAETSGRNPEVDALHQAAQGFQKLYQIVVNRESKNKELLARIADHGADMKFEIVRDAEGEQTGWKVTDPFRKAQDPETGKIAWTRSKGQGESVPAQLEDLGAVVDAGFNDSLFQWDGFKGAKALARINPKAALDRVKFVLRTERARGDGGISRETRSWNGLGLQRLSQVKLDAHGLPIRQANAEAPNPELMGPLVSKLLGVAPAETKEVLPEVVDYLRRTRSWWEKNLGVRDKNGNLVGFRWTNLGSGRDNAPRCLDEPGCLAIDAISYYKQSLVREAEFLEFLGRYEEADAAEAQARQVGQTIDRYYKNPKLDGMYSDITVKPDGGVIQSNVRTMAGFWPYLDGTSDPTEMGSVVESNFHDPEHFGGAQVPPSVAFSHEGQRDAAGKKIMGKGGNYWRGGYWPPDAEQMSDSFLNHGMRAEAYRLQTGVMDSMADATRLAQQGLTPSLLNGKTPTPEELRQMASQPLYAFESQGWIRQSAYEAQMKKIHGPDWVDPTSQNHRPGYAPERSDWRSTFNIEKIHGAPGSSHDLPVHNTRNGLAWSQASATQDIDVTQGINPVAPFSAYALFTEPYLARRNWLRFTPSLKPLAWAVEKNPSITREQFQSLLNQELERNPALQSQLDLATHGYVEIAPPVDPGPGGMGVTELPFQGKRYSVLTQRHGDVLSVTVKSDTPIPMQLHEGFTGEGARSVPTDSPAASSDLFLLGGGHGKKVMLSDGSTAWQYDLQTR